MTEDQNINEENFQFKCPACKVGNIEMNKVYYDSPDGDKILIIKFECNRCNFHKNDVIPFTTHIEPGIMKLTITNEEDLKSKIYRSPIGELEIPEFGLSVEPGPNADFYYTNVEGILDRFITAVSLYYNDESLNEEEKESIRKILQDLDEAKNGNQKFTLVLSDHGGGSYIIPVDNSKYEFKKASKES